ncbi:hypothetical protein JCM10213_002441 [Rhodosporidiobolus nylandii]
MAPLIDLAASRTEQQWLYERRELARSPSILEGMKPAEELRQRQRMIQVVWQLKDALGATQLVAATAATFLQRFYMRETFQKYDKIIMAGAATYLACKNEENPTSIKTVVQNLLGQRRGLVGRRYINQYQDPLRQETQTEEFRSVRKQLVAYEEVLLSTLCFDLTVRHPHFFVLETAKRAWKDDEAAKNVGKVGWHFANESLALPLCLLYRPHLVAAACIVLACAQLDLPLPAVPLSRDEQITLHESMDSEEGEEPPAFEEEVYWLDVLEVQPEELEEPVADILHIFTRAEDEFVVQSGARLAEWVRPVLASLPRRPSPASADPAPPSALPGIPTATSPLPNGDAGDEDAEADVKMKASAVA